MKNQQMKQLKTMQGSSTFNSVKVTETKLALVWWATIKLGENA